MFEHLKTLVIVLALAVIGVGIYQYLHVWSDLEGKLAEANRLNKDLENSRAELNASVTNLDRQEQSLHKEIAAKDQSVAKLETDIKNLQEQFRLVRNATLGIIDEQKIAHSFKQKYGFQDESIKVRSFPIYDPVSGDILLNQQGKPIVEPYLTVPIDYIKESNLAKDESTTCKEQQKLRENITTLEREKAQLVGTVAELKEEKAQAYLKAYEEAYSSFSTIHKNYVDLLNAPPKVEITPSWLQLMGGFLGGVIICKL